MAKSARTESERILVDVLLPTLLRLGWPVVLGAVFVSGLPLVENFWLGRLIGVDALTVAAVAMPAILVVQCVKDAAPLGAMVLAAQSIGAGKQLEAAKIVANGAVLSLLVALVLMAVGLIFQSDIVELLTMEPSLHDTVRSYLIPFFLSLPVLALMQFLSNVMDASGQTRVGLFREAVHFVSIVVFLPLFISSVDLGVAGVHLARLGAGLGLVFLLWRILQAKRSELGIARLRAGQPWLNLQLWKSMLWIGIPPQLAHFSRWFLLGAVVMKIASAGSEAAAGFGIAYSSMIIGAVPLAGIRVTNAIVVGQCYGAKRTSRIVQSFRLCLAASLLYAGLFVLATVFASDAFFSLFTDDPKVVKNAVLTIEILRWSLPFGALQHIFVSTYTALGQTRSFSFLFILTDIAFLFLLGVWDGDPQKVGMYTFVAVLPVRVFLLGCLFPTSFLRPLRDLRGEKSTGQ